jgi:acyl carrier protein
MITKEEILAKITEVLKEELYYNEPVEPACLIRDLELDSIQMMQLFVYLEESFAFEFGDSTVFENARDMTVGQLADLMYGFINKVEIGPS